jgi:hypothetical protein
MRFFRHDVPLTPAWDHVNVSARLVKEHIWSVFYLGFLPSLVYSVGLVLVLADRAFLEAPFAGPVADQTLAGLIITGVGLIWTTLVYPGWILFRLRTIRGQETTALECFQDGLPRFLSVLILSGLQISYVFLGLLALIIPGFFAVRGAFLAQYYLMDKELGPSDALSRSIKESKPISGYLWGTIGVIFLFSFLGSTVSYIPVVGVLLNIAIPLIYAFGPALRYEEASKAVPKIRAPKDHVTER